MHIVFREFVCNFQINVILHNMRYVIVYTNRQLFVRVRIEMRNKVNQRIRCYDYFQSDEIRFLAF